MLIWEPKPCSSLTTFLLPRGFRFTRITGSAQAACDNATSPTHFRLLLTSFVAVSTVRVLANSLLSSFTPVPCFRTSVARTRRRELGIFYVFKVPILLGTEYHPWELQQEKGQQCGSSFDPGTHHDIFMGLQLLEWVLLCSSSYFTGFHYLRSHLVTNESRTHLGFWSVYQGPIIQNQKKKKSQTMMPVMDVEDGKPSEVKLSDHKQSCPRENHAQSIAKTHWPMLDNPAQPSHPYSSKDALAIASGPKLERPFSDIPSYILDQYIIFCHWISWGEWPVIHL